MPSVFWLSTLLFFCSRLSSLFCCFEDCSCHSPAYEFSSSDMSSFEIMTLLPSGLASCVWTVYFNLPSDVSSVSFFFPLGFSFPTSVFVIAIDLYVVCVEFFLIW